MSKYEQELAEVRSILESDLFEFAKYTHPHYEYGDIHRKVCKWLQESEDGSNALLLLPRGHLKSHLLAVWVAWEITRSPWLTIVYLTSGEDLLEAQMRSIKNILTCPEYRLLWPEMVHEEEGKRSLWNAKAFSVDHPEREVRQVRDATVIGKTVKSNSTGLHCDRLAIDDVVVPQNAYTQIGRREVQAAVAQFASIKNPGAITKAVGTVYHPQDVYSDLREAQYPVIGEDGEIVGTESLWTVMLEVVEDSPNQDGTGNFLWPRVFSPTTRQWYGFDRQTLAIKKAEYESMNERVQFYAQYYMEANDPDSHRLSRDSFQYYDKKHLSQDGSRWYYKGVPLNIYCGMDIATTGLHEKTGKTADFTAIAVLGMTPDRDYFVLDLKQFKTSDFSVYYNELIDLHNYWNFRKVVIETNAAGKQIKQAIEGMIYENGGRLTIEGINRGSRDGSKLERHAAVVEPAYRQGKVWHYKGGYIPELEEQILLQRPRHDDLEDALCIAMESARPPANRAQFQDATPVAANVYTHERFGGRRRR